VRIYNYTAGGLAVTRIVAYGSAASVFYQSTAFSLAQSPSWFFTTDKKEKFPRQLARKGFFLMVWKSHGVDSSVRRASNRRLAQSCPGAIRP
jgi:hypothetical protein